MNTVQSKALNDWQRQFIESVMGGEPQCSGCLHANDDNMCKAYPDGIPLEIVSGEHDHTEPYPGDNGIRYEAVGQSATEALVQALEYNPFHDAKGRFTSGSGAGSRVNLNDPRAVAVAKGEGEGKGVLLGKRGDERNYRDMNKFVHSGQDYIYQTEKWGESLFTDWKGQLTDSEFTTIKGYANKDFYKLNKQLRGRPSSEGTFAPVELKRLCNNMDNALGKSQIHEDMIVYRGGGNNAMRVAVHDGKIAVGTVFRDKGYVSTSIVERGSFYGNQQVQIKIRVPKGTHAAFIGWDDLTGYKNEAEMILPRNQRFLVRKVETHTQGVRLELDLL